MIIKIDDIVCIDGQIELPVVDVKGVILHVRTDSGTILHIHRSRVYAVWWG